MCPSEATFYPCIVVSLGQHFEHLSKGVGLVTSGANLIEMKFVMADIYVYITRYLISNSN